MAPPERRAIFNTKPGSWHSHNTDTASQIKAGPFTLEKTSASCQIHSKPVDPRSHYFTYPAGWLNLPMGGHASSQCRVATDARRVVKKEKRNHGSSIQVPSRQDFNSA